MYSVCAAFIDPVSTLPALFLHPSTASPARTWVPRPRLYSQYDPLHRGVLLSLLQGGCPSDGFLSSGRAAAPGLPIDVKADPDKFF